MSSYATEEEPDLLNLNTYGWAEWTVFTTMLSIFGGCCFLIGICYHKWRMKNHILTDDDIEDRADDDDDNKIRFRATFAKFTAMLTPRSTSKTSTKGGGKSFLFSPTLKAKPETWNKDQINRHLGQSVVHSPPHLKIEDGKVSFITLDEVNEPNENDDKLPMEEDGNGRTRAQAPKIEMTESQIANVVGRSITKAPITNTDDTQNETENEFDKIKAKKRKDSVSNDGDDEDEEDEEESDDQVRINMNEKNEENKENEEIDEKEHVDETNKILNGNKKDTDNADLDSEQNANPFNQPPRAFGHGFSVVDQGNGDVVIHVENANIMDELIAPVTPIGGDNNYKSPTHSAVPSMNQYGNSEVFDDDQELEDVHTGFGSIN